LTVPRFASWGIDKQENLRTGAIMIFCGEAKAGESGEASSSSAFSKLVQSAMAPVTYGTTDVDLDHRDGGFSTHHAVRNVYYS
jgi:hypothetical protein